MFRIAVASILGSRGPTYGERQFRDWSRRRSGLLNPTTPPEQNSNTVTELKLPPRLCPHEPRRTVPAPPCTARTLMPPPPAASRPPVTAGRYRQLRVASAAI